MRSCVELLAAAERLGLAALVEVHDVDEMTARASTPGPRIIGVNSRNLRTLTVDPACSTASIAAAARRRHRRGRERHPDAPRTSPALTAAGYDAFLVGERSSTQPDPGAALRELRGRPVMSTAMSDRRS